MAFGFTDITHGVCKLDAVKIPSSLFCSANTLMASGAELTYKFADIVHPTTGYSKFIAEKIFTEIPH